MVFSPQLAVDLPALKYMHEEAAVESLAEYVKSHTVVAYSYTKIYTDGSKDSETG